MKSMEFIQEVKALIVACGGPKIANLLGVTERAMQFWIAEKEPKMPRIETQAKIHELFRKLKAGEPLEPDDKRDGPDYRDEVIRLLREKNDRLQKDLDASLNELREGILLIRTLGSVNRSMLEELLAKARKSSLEKIGLETNRLFAEHYKKSKAGGNDAYDSK